MITAKADIRKGIKEDSMHPTIDTETEPRIKEKYMGDGLQYNHKPILNPLNQKIGSIL